MTTRGWTAAVAVLAFAAAFLVASVAVGGEGAAKPDRRSLDVRLAAVAALPELKEDPAVIAKRLAERRERRLAARRLAARRLTARQRAARRRAAARRAAAAEIPFAEAPPAPAESDPDLPPAFTPAPAPVPAPAPPAAAPAPEPPPPPPETFDDSG